MVQPDNQHTNRDIHCNELSRNWSCVIQITLIKQILVCCYCQQVYQLLPVLSNLVSRRQPQYPWTLAPFVFSATQFVNLLQKQISNIEYNRCSDTIMTKFKSKLLAKQLYYSTTIICLLKYSFSYLLKFIKCMLIANCMYNQYLYGNTWLINKVLLYQSVQSSYL